MSNRLYTFQVLGGVYSGMNGLAFKQGDMFQTKEPLDTKFPNKFLRIAVGGAADLPNADMEESARQVSPPAAPAVPSADVAAHVTPVINMAVAEAARKAKTEKAEEPRAVVTNLPMPNEVPDNATDVTNQFISQENGLGNGLMVWKMPFGGYAVTNCTDRHFISDSIFQNRTAVQKFITTYKAPTE